MIVQWFPQDALLHPALPLPLAPQPPSLWSAPPGLPSGSYSVLPRKQTTTWALSDSLELCLPKTPAGSLCPSERRNNSEEAGSISKPSLGRSGEGVSSSEWLVLPSRQREVGVKAWEAEGRGDNCMNSQTDRSGGQGPLASPPSAVAPCLLEAGFVPLNSDLRVKKLV